MRRPRLFWRIYLTYLLVVVLCTVAVGILAATSTRSFYLSHTERELRARAALVRQQVLPLVGAGRSAQLERLVRELGAASGTRITVIAGEGLAGAPLGEVLAESTMRPELLPNHRDRPEFAEAMRGGTGKAIRFSSTLNENMMYVALPVTRQGARIAVVRAAVSITTVEHALVALYWRIGLTALVIAMLAGLIGLLMSRRISRQVDEIKEGAEAFAAGEFGHKLPVPRTAEFASVAESLNTMAEELDEKIRTVTRERNEREAVLVSMIEGVVAVDTEERVLTMNEAAAHLIGTERTSAVGCSIQEVVRNVELQGMVAAALAGRGPVESELTLRVGSADRTLQAHASLLRGEDDDGAAVGAVVVLNDVTRLKRLEAVRRDFVANVSHELKTPVTSIKGFTETLLDGASDDPESSRRFLRIIAGQADRLNSIIEDLLALSTLEATSDGRPALAEADVCDVVTVAVEVCEPKAQARGIRLDTVCVPSVFAAINPPLLEQAVVNLIDNAVKYSPEASEVQVELEQTDAEIIIRVIDHGPGIPREHLSRLFERFYRVDKARSRDLGGTGLGLSIVKHIAQVHGGRVDVESALGRGSTFSLHLPRR
jgi:two-component system, OmpR family, phosphate regulon sensor histidine kinase PhoR